MSVLYIAFTQSRRIVYVFNWLPGEAGVKDFGNGCAPGFSHVYSFQFQSCQHIGSLTPPCGVINLRPSLLLGMIGTLVSIQLILKTMEYQILIPPHVLLGTQIRSWETELPSLYKAPENMFMVGLPLMHTKHSEEVYTIHQESLWN